MITVFLLHLKRHLINARYMASLPYTWDSANNTLKPVKSLRVKKFLRFSMISQFIYAILQLVLTAWSGHPLGKKLLAMVFTSIYFCGLAFRWNVKLDLIAMHLLNTFLKFEPNYVAGNLIFFQQYIHIKFFITKVLSNLRLPLQENRHRPHPRSPLAPDRIFLLGGFSRCWNNRALISLHSTLSRIHATHVSLQHPDSAGLGDSNSSRLYRCRHAAASLYFCGLLLDTSPNRSNRPFMELFVNVVNSDTKWN